MNRIRAPKGTTPEELLGKLHEPTEKDWDRFWKIVREWWPAAQAELADQLIDRMVRRDTLRAWAAGKITIDPRYKDMRPKECEPLPEVRQLTLF